MLFLQLISVEIHQAFYVASVVFVVYPAALT